MFVCRTQTEQEFWASKWPISFLKYKSSLRIGQLTPLKPSFCKDLNYLHERMRVSAISRDGSIESKQRARFAQPLSPESFRGFFIFCTFIKNPLTHLRPIECNKSGNWQTPQTRCSALSRKEIDSNLYGVRITTIRASVNSSNWCPKKGLEKEVLTHRQGAV